MAEDRSVSRSCEKQLGGKVVLGRAAARYSETSSADESPRQGAKASFDGRNVCQKCFCVTFDESNKAFAVSGTSYFHRERTCD